MKNLIKMFVLAIVVSFMCVSCDTCDKVFKEKYVLKTYYESDVLGEQCIETEIYESNDGDAHNTVWCYLTTYDMGYYNEEGNKLSYYTLHSDGKLIEIGDLKINWKDDWIFYEEVE